MSLLKQLAMSGNAAQAPTYVDDVFSSYPYTGTGATQSIVNGIDLSTKGGLTWIKQRSGTQDHVLFDTVRGVNKYVRSQSTAAESSALTDLLTAFNTNGFTIGADASTAGIVNASGSTYSSWSFREAAKFFDVVTYTGNGTTQTISHNLGVTVGMIAIKKLSAASSIGWEVWHRSLTSGSHVWLNRTDAETAVGATSWGNNSVVVDPTSTSFTIGQNADMNTNGATYVAYLFAHNSATDGLIQCGSYVGTGAAGVNVTLGWEPQAVLVKRATGGTGSWYMIDSARGMSLSDTRFLLAEALSSESSFGSAAIVPTATGFRVDSAGTGLNAASSTYIYMAIRRSNKPPTTGTDVFFQSSLGAGQVSTPSMLYADTVICLSDRFNSSGNSLFFDRLRGIGNTSGAVSQRLIANTTGLETTVAGTSSVSAATTTNAVLSDTSPSIRVNVGQNGSTTSGAMTYFFRRSVGVFDVVCYTGSGVDPISISHSLGVVPELIIIKKRNAVSTNGWMTLAPSILTMSHYLLVNDTTGKISLGWSSAYLPDATTFKLTNTPDVNAASNTYVAYLFATKTGISKVGSYTGNGSSQNIDCGFAGGARFIMIKRTDAAGDWYLWDVERGIIAANDPHLSLNTTAAEVTTDDSIDPLAAGFIVNQVAATNINVNAATYIYLAFA